MGRVGERGGEGGRERVGRVGQKEGEGEGRRREERKGRQEGERSEEGSSIIQRHSLLLVQAGWYSHMTKFSS